MFESNYKIGDPVSVDLGDLGYIKTAYIYAVKFKEYSVVYDLRIHCYEDGENHTILENVKSVLIKPIEQSNLTKKYTAKNKKN